MPFRRLFSEFAYIVVSFNVCNDLHKKWKFLFQNFGNVQFGNTDFDHSAISFRPNKRLKIHHGVHGFIHGLS
jgi:hypothetical protein